MRWSGLWLALGVWTGGLAAGSDVKGVKVINKPPLLEDFSWVSREIKKAPAFVSQKVRYCIWVLGTGKQSVMVMAWDESEGTGKGYDTLYADRNFNGDLTDEGEKHYWKNLAPGEKRLPEYYHLENSKVAGGNAVFNFKFESHCGENNLGWSAHLTVEGPGGHSVNLHNVILWSHELKTAPLYTLGRGAPTPYLNEKAPGESLGAWTAGAGVSTWYRISALGDKLAHQINFPYGGFPGGAPTTTLRLLDDKGVTVEEMPLTGGCACGGGYGHHLQLPLRVPPGKHVVVSSAPRTPEYGGPAEYHYPVEIKNDDYGKPLADPAHAALKQAFPGADVRIVSLRRATGGKDEVKAFASETLLPARTGDNSLEHGTDHHSGREFVHGHEDQLPLGPDGRYRKPYQVLMKFDLSGLPKDAQVLGAQLRVASFRGDFVGTKPGHKLRAYALREEWYETPQPDGAYSCYAGPRWKPGTGGVASATDGPEDPVKDRLPDAAGEADVGGFPAQDEKFRAFALDLTGTVKQWQEGKLPNHGFVLQCEGKLNLASSESADFVLRPTLVIAYKGGEATAKFTSPAGEDLETAKVNAARLKRPLMLYFFSPTCGVCKKAREVFADRHIGELIKGRTVPVTLPIEQHGKLAQELGVQAVPTVVFLGPDGAAKKTVEAKELQNVEVFLRALSEIK